MPLNIRGRRVRVEINCQMSDEFLPERDVRERVGWADSKLADLMRELTERQAVARSSDRRILALTGIVSSLLSTRLMTQTQAYDVLYAASRDERFQFYSLAGYVLGHLVSDLTDTDSIDWDLGQRVIRDCKDFFQSEVLAQEVFQYARFWKAKRFSLYAV